MMEPTTRSCSHMCHVLLATAPGMTTAHTKKTDSHDKKRKHSGTGNRTLGCSVQ
ncbi:hypothetical protein IF1G_09309 [Cordyceps javanica]|uniref:Uncharacterized protein n=1 Tax=Cordyceps javanica TaxID=43265 RepID=A0A545URZ1_9HYPO|nr:hypothetical protein IF1G_09309 [Cordyceps javanica]